ncbi:MAG TPA: SMI1/KNR4 family protein, partial [Acidimicrobiales bacterium]
MIGGAMELDFVTPPSPSSPDEIARVESSLGTSLPQAYRTFLELRGGGRPVANRSLSPAADRLGIGVTR